MERKKGKIKITLKSDLCAGSGFSFAGVIDSDVSLDEFGIPYISGRRLKGLLRDSLSNIPGYCSASDTDKLFGKIGADGSHGIRIGNGRVENYDVIIKDLAELHEFSDQDDFSSVNPRTVAPLFTSVKAQTRIDRCSGKADDGSLRFTRVINHYSPIDHKELIFFASVEYPAELSSMETYIDAACKATRNMGLNRTRGLGSVQLTFIPCDDNKPAVSLPSHNQMDAPVISFCIRNDSPLVLSAESDMESADVISGASVIGLLAGTYLAEGGSADDQMFKDLFLNGTVRFSDVTPALYSADGWKKLEPVPLCINRLKTTKKVVNTVFDPDSTLAEYNPFEGNQPKKMDGYFCLPGEYGSKMLNLKKEVIYHHERSSSDADGTLYYLEALSPNQYFAGDIYIDPNATDKRAIVKMLYSLLCSARFSFGKSKSAQYGSCSLVGMPIVQEQKPVISVEEGDCVLVTLNSDGVFLNESGCYTIREDEVRKIIAAELGIEPSVGEKSFLKTKTRTGYSSVWNMQKPQIPAVSAGSAFVFRWTKSGNDVPLFVGCKGIEGCGKISVINLKNEKYAVSCDKKTEVKRMDRRLTDLAPETKKIVSEVLLKQLSAEQHYSIMGGNPEFNTTSSALGRVTLMVKEAFAKYPEDIAAAKEDLKKRIDSIKGESMKKAAESLLRRVEKSFNEVFDKSLYYKTLSDMVGDAEAKACAEKGYFEYLMDILNYLKYKNKEAE